MDWLTQWQQELQFGLGSPVVAALQWLFIGYFVLLSLGYLALNLIALWVMRGQIQSARTELMPASYASFLPPISVLVPAYNEEATISGSIHSLLQLTYPEYEVIVVNDGSKDLTMQVLREQFQLVPSSATCPLHLACQPIQGIYQSSRYPNLKVIDKQNGGKADALNAGINLSRFPLFCGVDADSILQRDSLQRIIRPFLDDPYAIAAGGTVRIANGCEVKDGLLLKAALPEKLLPQLQIIEYLRGFLFGRLGWSPLNCLLIISGAFGVFRKSAVIEAGGYRHNTIGEDMELVVRLHKLFRLTQRPYRVYFIPDPVCWTEAPEDLATLSNQRVRWQRGLLESLMANRSLLFHRKAGAVGWLAYPFSLIFEAFGPAIEVAGYLFMLTAWLAGWLDPVAMLAFLVATIGFGVLISVVALVLEEMSYPVYPGRRSILRLFSLAIIENFGYRQLNSWWRLKGLWRWMRNSKSSWGAMKRSGQWQQAAAQTAKADDKSDPPQG
ncbi:glycosyltransferase [Rheinheimera sp.]|uniref:glycosyltransferase family 2 protein n=1 Tax=Rheinheimera sp. TaxID=1869214 RepID=UPI00307D12C7